MQRATHRRAPFFLTAIFLSFSLLSHPPLLAEEPSRATAIVQGAIDYWRDTTSVVEATMTIHREEWERTSRLRSYTSGDDNSLVRFLFPPKDAGNATLTLDKVMWNFVPRINKTIKVPPSMMGQSWMGSDFSYRDLAREDSIASDYTHTLLAETKVANHTLFVIEAIPKPQAAVVWGKEILHIRDDNIIMAHEFYDQAMSKVKELRSDEIGMLGQKRYPLQMTMTRLDEPDRWTRIRHDRGLFNIPIPEYAFTLSNLKSPREQFLEKLKDQ